jgi:CRP-like cAMP-binding protein
MLEDLTPDDFDKIAATTTGKTYKTGELVFAEGDAADYIYFIRSGRVSVFIQQFTAQEELSVLGPGQYFGEMAVLGKNKRSASVKALTDTEVLRMDQATFLDLCKTDRPFTRKIKAILAKRRDELALKENLIESTGVHGKHLHISIKGDPSLRETAFERERYHSVVDQVLPRLVPRLTDLLINRCAYQIYIHFNSGEIGVTTVFDPFNGGIHPVNKLVDEGYIERHFSRVSYAEKTQMIRRLYTAIAKDSSFGKLPEHFQHRYIDSRKDWQPMSAEQVGIAISRLPDLRKIPDFYLRNFMLSMTRDAIRMQFNCDGTHIVGAEDYLQFLEENLETG